MFSFTEYRFLIFVDLLFSSINDVKEYDGEHERYFLVRAKVCGAREPRSMYKGCLNDLCIKGASFVVLHTCFLHNHWEL